MNKHCRDGTWWYINTITWNHGYISRSLRWRLLQNEMPDTYRYHLIIIYIEQNCEEITMNHVSGLPCAFRKKGVIWITAKSIVTSTYFFVHTIKRFLSMFEMDATTWSIHSIVSDQDFWFMLLRKEVAKRPNIKFHSTVTLACK